MELEPGILGKWVWTDSDFEQMNWNNARIRAFASFATEALDQYSLVFDIDYAVSESPGIPPRQASYWIAPATLVFENVYDVEFYLRDAVGLFVIRHVARFSMGSDWTDTYYGKKKWLWLIEGTTESMRFYANGYRQFFRRRPILVESPAPQLTIEERGGLSFNCAEPEPGSNL